jgi:predicted DCC family thiol-disulfide oxidoreductase YuxK
MIFEKRQSSGSGSQRRCSATVFYDGACPLCRREIAHYRRLRGADELAWVDISQDQAALDAHGLSREQAMKRLHVLDASGGWQTGAWAFAELWSQLAAYRWLANLLRMTGTLPMLDRAYGVFARWRVNRHCNPGTCEAGADTRQRPIGENISTTYPSGANRHPQTQGERSCA